MPSNGAFVQQTPLFNIQYLDIDPALKELLVQMNQQINNMAMIINMKDTGYYDLNEFICGQVYWPINNPNAGQDTGWRPVFRKVIDIGATSPLPNTGCVSVPHGIPVNSNYVFTRIYGWATQPGVAFVPLPYASAHAAGKNIEVDIDSTNIVICTAMDYSAFTKVEVVLEYLTIS